MNKLVGSRSGALLPTPDSGHLGNLYNFLVTDWCTANSFHRALPIKKIKIEMQNGRFMLYMLQIRFCTGVMAVKLRKYGLSRNHQ
jgi:hypothetical protein